MGRRGVRFSTTLWLVRLNPFCQAVLDASGVCKIRRLMKIIGFTNSNQGAVFYIHTKYTLTQPNCKKTRWNIELASACLIAFLFVNTLQSLSTHPDIKLGPVVHVLKVKMQSFWQSADLALRHTVTYCGHYFCRIYSYWTQLPINEEMCGVNCWQVLGSCVTRTVLCSVSYIHFDADDVYMHIYKHSHIYGAIAAHDLLMETVHHAYDSSAGCYMTAWGNANNIYEFGPRVAYSDRCLSFLMYYLLCP